MRVLNFILIASLIAISTGCKPSEPQALSPINKTDPAAKNGPPSKITSTTPNQSSQATLAAVVPLPDPVYESKLGISLERAILERRSVREYSSDPLTLEEMGQLLWAAQGITEPERGFRAAPSAGATYPLEIYLIAGQVEGLSPGVYSYRPHTHDLELITEGDRRQELFNAALQQTPVREAAINLVFSAVYQRTTQRYGERGIKYVHMEVGHAAQNVYLQVVSLGLGTVVIGAFDDQTVRRALNLPLEEVPLYIMPVGRKGAAPQN